MPGVDNRIVVYYYDAILGRVDIELNAICTELHGTLKRSEGVLRMTLVRAAVRNAFGWPAGGCGQAFLSVVALCSMSAKDMSAGGQGQSALTAGSLERLPDEAP
jgi:hypothetical protein